MTPNLQQKAIDCLMIASHRMGPTRKELFNNAVLKYSEKAVETKMEELSRRGYIEYMSCAYAGWLTEKGKQTLEYYR